MTRGALFGRASQAAAGHHNDRHQDDPSRHRVPTQSELRSSDAPDVVLVPRIVGPIIGWMAHPTPYDDLNGVLRALVAGAHAALFDNLCGVYLVGSFALGGADEHSDVDFVVATHRALSEWEQAALQSLHGGIFEQPVAWAQHLEGSYAPSDSLRCVDPTRRPFFFLDNGARELVWDSHCNTALVRWTLRRHGIALHGPPAGQIVDPVDSDDLRFEAIGVMREYARWARELRDSYAAGDELAFNRWAQPYLVLTLCRVLHTLNRGEVVPKQEAAEWAAQTLDSQWKPLIQQALRDRPDPSRRYYEVASPEAVNATMALVGDALRAVGPARSSRGRASGDFESNVKPPAH
jgi:hypothetical protein